MEEVKKHKYLNNINSMKALFSISEFFNIFGFLIVWCIFIYRAFIFLDLNTIFIFLGYAFIFIINLIIIRVFKEGLESINSLFKHLLQSINEIENKTK